MLTEHQQGKLQEALAILKSSKRLLIKGSAGVGKTFFVDYLVGQLEAKKIFCTAPTNPAVAVLADKVNDRGGKVIFLTTHSALKCKRKIDYRTGDISFPPEYNPQFPPLDCNICIIDEASMLNTELLSYLEEYAIKFNVILIFLGDQKQLPPVGEDSSKVFTSGYPTIELTEIVRQGEGNPIIDLSRNLSLMAGTENTLVNGKGYLFTSNKQKIVDALAEENGGTNYKFLAFTNAKVLEMNRLVRMQIYGKPKKIELGEVLMFNTSYGDYATNEEITVNTLSEETRLISYPTGRTETKAIELKVYRVNAPAQVSLFNPDNCILVVHEDSEVALTKLNKSLMINARAGNIGWPQYYQFLEKFADMKYTHAITVHKSQGQTYENAFIDYRDILRYTKSDKSLQDKLFYTAITRAKSLSIIHK